MLNQTTNQKGIQNYMATFNQNKQLKSMVAVPNLPFRGRETINTITPEWYSTTRKLLLEVKEEIATLKQTLGKEQ